MKRLLTGACVLFSIAVSAGTIHQKTDNLSYAMGFKMGQALKIQSIAINTQNFKQGLQDGYMGQKPTISKQAMQLALSKMQEETMHRIQQKTQEAADQNAKAGQAFLSANAKKPGVTTTASGLQYKIITPGAGVSPAANDTVTVNYEGKLINGTVFDSSYQRGKPATFVVNQVIPGWQEALKLMKPGATWMLYIPSKLAYGAQGAPGAIGPNETLIFKVNLISVKN